MNNAKRLQFGHGANLSASPRSSRRPFVAVDANARKLVPTETYFSGSDKSQATPSSVTLSPKSRSSPKLRGPRAPLLSRLDRPLPPHQQQNRREQPSPNDENDQSRFQDVVPARRKQTALPMKRQVARKSWSQFLKQRDGMDLDIPEDEVADFSGAPHLRNPALFPRTGDLTKLHTYHTNPSSLKADWELGDEPLTKLNKAWYGFEMEMRTGSGDKLEERKLDLVRSNPKLANLTSNNTVAPSASSPPSTPSLSVEMTPEDTRKKNMDDLAKLGTRGGIPFTVDRELLRPARNPTVFSIPSQRVTTSDFNTSFDPNDYFGRQLCAVAETVLSPIPLQSQPATLETPVFNGGWSDIGSSTKGSEWLMKRAENARLAWAAKAGVELRDHSRTPLPPRRGGWQQQHTYPSNGGHNVWEWDWETKWEILRALMNEKSGSAWRASPVQDVMDIDG